MGISGIFFHSNGDKKVQGMGGVGDPSANLISSMYVVNRSEDSS